ncbi:MAG: histidinol-phosphate transaminase [Microthrixaceae bacterium]
MAGPEKPGTEGDGSAPDRLPGRPRMRGDLELMPGYHSPQLDVEVRLNTNEAPEPPPARFTSALAERLAAVDWNRYPDRSAVALRTAIARAEGSGVPAEGAVASAAGQDEAGGFDVSQVFAANGSNEVLQSICLAYGGPGRSALTFEPTYALHSHIAKVCGTEVHHGQRSDDFELDVAEVVSQVDAHRPAITFLCSPNNPTGGALDDQLIATALAAVSSVGGLLVVDEAYGQFSPTSALSLVHEDAPLVVTRTFSKTWSAAALRLGYAIGPSWLVEDLFKVALPYHLDAPKQVAGLLALEFEPEMHARVAALVEQRGRIVAGLDDLPVTQWRSDANFVLFRPDRARGEDVWQDLVDRRVLVRNCASWPGLEGCLRVSVGTAAENDRFLSALAQILT